MRPATTRTLWFLFLALVLCALPRIGHAQEDRPTDLVLVIDGSRSMEETDPGFFRRDAVKAFIDLVADQVGRVAITQFGGWIETAARGDEILPLTELPANEEALLPALQIIKNRVDDSVEPFGSGTDFLRALGAGLRPIIEAHEAAGSGRKIWVILFTDGNLDVNEARGVRKAYEERAVRDFGESGPVTVNQAATAMFEEDVLPGLLRDDLFLTSINLSGSEGNENEFLEMLASKVPGPGKVLNVTKESLRTVFLEALATVPTSFLKARASKGLDYQALEAVPDEVVKMQLPFFPAASGTQAIVFSESPLLDVSVVGPQGAIVDGNPGIRIAGGESKAGARYRIVSLGKGAATGDYEVRIRSRADEPVTIEHLWTLRMEATPILEAPEQILPGEEVFATISLLGKDNKPMDDTFVLNSPLQASLVHITPDEQRIPLPPTTFLGESLAIREDIDCLFGDHPQLGVHKLELVFNAFKRPEGDWAFESELVTKEVLVRAPVAVAVTPTALFVGDMVTVTATVSSGYSYPPSFAVFLTTPAGEQMIPALDEDPETSELRGRLVLNDVGTYEVHATADESPYAIEVQTPELIVSERAIVLVNASGTAINEIEVDLKWQEQSEGIFSGQVYVLARPGELWELYAVSATASVGTASSEPGLGSALPALVTATASNAGVGALVATTEQGELLVYADMYPGYYDAPTSITVTVVQPTDISPETFTSVLKLRATIAGLDVEREIPVRVNFPDRADKEWWRKVKLALMVLIPLLLLLLLLLLLYLLRPIFDRHRFLYVTLEGEVLETHLCKDLVTGTFRPRGTGPPEVPETFGIAAKGVRRGATPQVAQLRDDMPLWVMDERIEAPMKLRDGDRVSFLAEEEPYTYLYFSGDVPDDLTPYLPEIVEDEDDDELDDDEIIIDMGL